MSEDTKPRAGEAMARLKADQYIARQYSNELFELDRALRAASGAMQFIDKLPTNICDGDRLRRAYGERNALVVGFAKAALAAGWRAGRGTDANVEWDDAWRHVVYVELPDRRQMSWHIGPDHVALLDGLPQYDGKWNGTYLSREPSQDWAKFKFPMLPPMMELATPDGGVEHVPLSKPAVKRCLLCKRALDVPGEPGSVDCGGDCATCVRDCEDEGGPDTEDGHDFEGFPGGCRRCGCPGGDECWGRPADD